MKILIVDDEPKIRNGLKKLIESRNSQWSVVGAVEDGEHAIDVIEREAVDVMLVDINMPNIDGLQLIDIINEKGFKPIVIIISGYATFEYAQKAIGHNVIGYILKPVAPQKIEEILNEAENIFRMNQETEEKRYFVENSIDELREKFLYDLVFGAQYFTEGEISEKCSKLSVPDKNFSVIVLRFDEANDAINSSEIKKAIREYLTSYKYSTVFYNGFGCFTLLVYFDENYNASRFLEELQAAILNISDYSITKIMIGVGGVYKNPVKLITSYEESLKDLKNRVGTIKNDDIIQGTKEIKDSEEALLLDLINNRVMNLSSVVVQTISYIKGNFNLKLNLSTIAEYVYVHPTYLSELFKKETGININEFITYYRVYKAKELLGKIENKIYMVANLVGFGDQRYFSQVFKKKTGLTPVEYKEKCFFNQIGGH